MQVRKFTTRIRSGRLALLAVVTTLVLAACGGTTSSTWATVDGIAITESDVSAFGAEPLAGLTAPSEDLRNVVSELIFDTAGTVAAARDFGVEITDEDIDERLTDPPERWVDLFTSASADETVGQGQLESLATRTILLDTVGPELVKAEFETWENMIEEAPELVVTVCVRHILTETIEQAEDALARVQAGEDFIAVAAEVSGDPGSPEGLIGGDTCPAPLNVSPEFTQAMVTLEIGEVGGPVQSDFGFHVIRVEERVVPEAADLEANAIAFLDGGVVSDFFSSWYSTTAREADVVVASPLGTWSPDAIAIAPPGS